MGTSDKVMALLVVICGIALLAASYAAPCVVMLEKLGAALR